MTWYLEAWKKYGQFSGRSSRKAYWMFFLLNTVIMFFLAGLEQTLRDQAGTSVSSLIYQLAVLIPGLSLGARRMHDTGHSGWWLLAPIANLVFLLQPSKSVENMFGEVPTDVTEGRSAFESIWDQRLMAAAAGGFIAFLFISIVRGGYNPAWHAMDVISWAVIAWLIYELMYQTRRWLTGLTLVLYVIAAVAVSSWLDSLLFWIRISFDPYFDVLLGDIFSLNPFAGLFNPERYPYRLLLILEGMGICLLSYMLIRTRREGSSV